MIDTDSMSDMSINSNRRHPELIFGNAERIFINMAAGCDARCKYCYLPLLGFTGSVNVISGFEAAKIVSQMNCFEPGPYGTVLSFGCYSECWNETNKNDTLAAIQTLAQYGNYIQFATKQVVSERELRKLNNAACFDRQIGINISIPTVSGWQSLEAGTARPEYRASAFQYQDRYKGIYFTLYIKPVLEKITIRDIRYYSEWMRQYHVPAVVGSRFFCRDREGSWNMDISSAPIGDGALYVEEKNDEKIITDELSWSGEVYRHSLDIISTLRDSDVAAEFY